MIPQPEIHVQARAVILVEHHLLVCKTTGLTPDFYFLPGGHIEHHERARETLGRELQEEIGFPFKVGRFLGCMEYFFDPKVMTYAKCHTHEYNFIFEAHCDFLKDPRETLVQQEKHIEILWLPLEKLKDEDFRPSALKNLLPQWLEKDLDFAFQSALT